MSNQNYSLFFQGVPLDGYLIKVMVGAVWEPSAPTGAPPLPPNPPFSRKSNLGGFEDLRGGSLDG